MKFSEADSGAGYLISGYGPDFILVGGRRWSEGLLIAPDQLIPGWGPASVADLAPLHFAPFLPLAPQVVLIGTGGRLIFPHPGCWRALSERGIGVEVMDTGAACRTYNILMAEGRKVAAGLLLA